MTTYNTIADSEIDPESPATTSLFTKLRNNLLAVQENDGTAPDVVQALTIVNQGALAIKDTVDAGDIDANSIRMSELYTAIGAYDTTSLGSGATFTTEGYWALSCTTDDTSLEYQAYLNGSWVKIYNLTSAQTLQWIVSGSFRVWNRTGSFKTLTHQRFIG